MKNKEQATNQKQKTVNKKKREQTRSVIAIILTLVILLSGTLAWQAFDQEALNQFKGLGPSPGARLHDDYDGQNKDVYVENFITEESGGEPVYARIRIDEYFEYGEGAGIIEGESGGRSPGMVILPGDYNRHLVEEEELEEEEEEEEEE